MINRREKFFEKKEHRFEKKAEEIQQKLKKFGLEEEPVDLDKPI